MSGDYTDGALDIVLDVPLMFLATSFKPSCFLTSAELYRCLKSSSVFFFTTEVNVVGNSQGKNTRSVFLPATEGSVQLRAKRVDH
jgi:hypothetical protein